MKTIDLLTKDLRVLLSWDAHPCQVPPITISENQVNICTKFPDIVKAVDPPPIAGQTPDEPYDIYDFVVNNLGLDANFDLILVSISGIKINLPYNIRHFNCPTVAIITDTHHGYKCPISELLTYLSLENYDYICFPYCRQHMHWFYACGLDNLGWMPLITMTNFPHEFLEERERKAIFVCGALGFHPYRSKVIEALIESKLNVEAKTLDRIKSSQAYANALISLNCSLNGDVNLRNLEIISAGGFLLTDQVSPQSGFDKLLRPGEDCDVYSSIEEAIEKVAYYLNHPKEAVLIAKNAYSKFYESLHPNYRINDLYNWIFHNDKSSLFLNDYDSRFEISRAFAELLETRLAIYEQIQELHRLQANVSILVDGNCEIIFAIDLVDLSRAKIVVNSNDEEKIKVVEQLGLASQICFSNNVLGLEWDVYISKSHCKQIKAKFNILLDESDMLVFSPLQIFANFVRSRITTVDGKSLPISFSFFHDSASQYVINEIFNNKCYPILSFLTDVNVIVDVGANVGFATAYFRCSYPEAQIYCFEPDPVAFLLLRDNCRQLGRCTPYPFGLYSDDTCKTLYFGESSVHRSIHKNSLCNRSQTVELKRADSFFMENGITSIDILKVDTEGCEVEILRRIMIHTFGIKVIYIRFYSEEDRRIIDQLLSPRYLLWSAKIDRADRGNLCYINRIGMIPI
jgi:FkbM family methyltransferase